MNPIQVYLALNDLKKDAAKLSACSATIVIILNKLLAKFESAGSNLTDEYIDSIHTDLNNFGELMAQLNDILSSVSEHGKRLQCNE